MYTTELALVLRSLVAIGNGGSDRAGASSSLGVSQGIRSLAQSGKFEKCPEVDAMRQRTWFSRPLKDAG